MSPIRQPAVAGMFYPDDPDVLRRDVESMLRQAGAGGPPPKALIAPHAGYVYSGPVAATAYATLAPLAGSIERVVLVGPAHRVYVRGIAASRAQAFRTPLGDVPLERETLDRLADALPFVTLDDRPHAPEHSLEVHLPFLQVALGKFRLLPLCVGDASGEEVEQVLERLWGGPETLVVISSDLSHFHDYATAQRLDAQTTRAIERLDEATLSGERACGFLPIRRLLRHARKHGLALTTLDLRNSGDTAGPREHVVGYGAWLVRPRGAVARDTDTHEGVGEDDRQSLSALARASIEHGVARGRAVDVPLDGLSPRLRATSGSFVTLHRGGRLRGCIGTLSPSRPLALDVALNAFAAAFEDPRFPALAAHELDGLETSISVLGPSRPLAVSSEPELLAALRPGVDGLVLREGTRSGTFLPAVWEQLPEPSRFVAELKRKAGFAHDYWSASLTFERYIVESW